MSIGYATKDSARQEDRRPAAQGAASGWEVVTGHVPDERGLVEEPGSTILIQKASKPEKRAERSYRRILREAGFMSRSEARGVVAKGYRGDCGPARGLGPGEQERNEELNDLLNQLIKIIGIVMTEDPRTDHLFSRTAPRHGGPEKRDHAAERQARRLRREEVRPHPGSITRRWRPSRRPTPASPPSKPPARSHRRR